MTSLSAAYRTVVTGWFHAKVFVEHMVGFSHDALHVLAGVCLQLLAAAALRTSLASPKPWLIVAVLESLNEIADLTIEVWPDAGMQWGESAKDMLLTLTLPTLLLAVARWRPEWVARPAGLSSKK